MVIIGCISDMMMNIEGSITLINTIMRCDGIETVRKRVALLLMISIMIT